MKPTRLLPGMMIMQYKPSGYGTWCIAKGTLFTILSVMMSATGNGQGTFCCVRLIFGPSGGGLSTTEWRFYSAQSGPDVSSKEETLLPYVDPDTDIMTHPNLSFPWAVVSFGGSIVPPRGN